MQKQGIENIDWVACKKSRSFTRVIEQLNDFFVAERNTSEVCGFIYLLLVLIVRVFVIIKFGDWIPSHDKDFGFIMLGDRDNKRTYPSYDKFDQAWFELDLPFPYLKDLDKFTSLNYLWLDFSVTSNEEKEKSVSYLMEIEVRVLNFPFDFEGTNQV